MSVMCRKKKAESEDNMKKNVLCHCRTKFVVKETTFVWNIANFWNIYDIFDTLTSSEVEKLSFKIHMCIDKNNLKLRFFIHDSKDQIKNKINRCNIYIQGSKGAVLHKKWEIFCLNDVPLYEISIETFRQNESIYLPNNTLSVYFAFESYEKILHRTLIAYTSKPIIIPEIISNLNDLISDESDIFVTFLIEGKYCHVKRKLCTQIPYLDDLLKDSFDLKKEDGIIPLHSIEYDIFLLVILYLETGGLIDLKLHASDDSNYINKLHCLLEATDLYNISDLKLFCEERLIECTRKENVLQNLDIAINCNAQNLESFTKKFIKLHLDDMLNTTEFQEWIKNNSTTTIFLSDILKEELKEEEVLYNKSKSKNNYCNVCQILPKN